jgi:hypothetical protein
VLAGPEGDLPPGVPHVAVSVVLQRVVGPGTSTTASDAVGAG